MSSPPQARQCLQEYDSGISSPIHSLSFLPASRHLLLVAVGNTLQLLVAESLELVWRASTGSLERKVR